MKKFLLSTGFAFLVIASFGQNPCPSDAKRNNGNDCKNLPAELLPATGGGIELAFVTAPPATLQIKLIIDNNTSGTATVIEQTKKTDTRAGKIFLSWCFETDNLGPITGAGYSYQFYMDGNNNFQQDPGETVLLSCSNASLPVKFLSFNAQQTSGKVSLKWQTAQEINNKEFEIQRRSATGGFKTIATVPSKAFGGNSGTVLDYSFDDAENVSSLGQLYYRVKQVDIDDRVDYSEIRSVKNNAKNVAISVYPNPGRQPKITIPDGLGLVDVSVSDISGKEVQRWNSTNLKSMQLTNLRAGMYSIKVNVKETGEVLVNKVMIQ